MTYNFPEDYEQIKQQEYKKFKKYDPNNCNCYTARIGNKFYKVKKDVGYIDLTKNRFKHLSKEDMEAIEQDLKLKEQWEEIIATANNQDPNYSFNLFKGLMEEKCQ